MSHQGHQREVIEHDQPDTESHKYGHDGHRRTATFTRIGHLLKTHLEA